MSKISVSYRGETSEESKAKVAAMGVALLLESVAGVRRSHPLSLKDDQSLPSVFQLTYRDTPQRPMIQIHTKHLGPRAGNLLHATPGAVGLVASLASETILNGPKLDRMMLVEGPPVNGYAHCAMLLPPDPRRNDWMYHDAAMGGHEVQYEFSWAGLTGTSSTPQWGSLRVRSPGEMAVVMNVVVQLIDEVEEVLTETESDSERRAHSAKPGQGAPSRRWGRYRRS